MRLLTLLGMMALVIMLTACQYQVPPTITSFEECVEAGNQVMESFPRQCRANGQTFVEEIDDFPEPPGTSEPSTPGETEFTACPEEAPEVCTREYRPVCALVDNGVRCVTTPCASADAETKSNACTACADDALGHYEGACEDIRFVVCDGIVGGFDPEEHAQQIGGVCVDICPGNYDTYTTQIAVKECIPHYGEEEIASWPTCERSSSDCSCVKTTETTRGEIVEDAQYRCVPMQYGERLLFTSGRDYLDKDGNQAVVIA